MLVQSEQPRQSATPEAERLAIIQAMIEEIRPALRRDGGDCQLIEVTGNK
ncbi:MAG: NifU family protein, partial [Stellaceae bacterium]